jgi:hypothetical protein
MRIRSWLQFSLRTLLIVPAIFSIALWWWFRPYAVEEADFYGMSRHYIVQRSWNGRKHYEGSVSLKYRDGKLAVRTDVDGVEVGTISLWGEGDERSEYWHTDGRKLQWDEWFMYMSGDYIPRQMRGESMMTEDEWRKAVEEFRNTYGE